MLIEEAKLSNLLANGFEDFKLLFKDILTISHIFLIVANWAFMNAV
jgi:hypothetical protein